MASTIESPLRTFEIKELHPSGKRHRILSMAFSPDGRYLATGNNDIEEIVLWDLRTGRPARRFGEYAYVVIFSPDGQFLASAGDKISLWDPHDGTKACEFDPGCDGLISSVAFSADGALMAGVTSMKRVTVWEMKSRQIVRQMEGQYGLFPISVAFSNPGRILAAKGAGGMLEIWNCELGFFDKLFGGGAPVVRDMRVTDYAGGGESQTAFLPNGRLIATGSDEGVIHLWDARSGATPIRELRGHSGGVWSLAFTPDGGRLVSGGSYNDHTTRLWDVALGRILKVYQAYPIHMNAMAVSPDGTTVAIGNKYGIVSLWGI